MIKKTITRSQLKSLIKEEVESRYNERVLSNRRTIALIENAIIAHEKGKSAEEGLSPEELVELWGGLKALWGAGKKAVADKAAQVGDNVEKFATKVGNKVYDNTVGAAQKFGNAVADKAQGMSDKVADVYNKGEVDAIVKKIMDLNNKYKAYTGKSFISKYNTVAPPVPRAQKRGGAQGK